MTVWVTGMSGMLGAALVRKLERLAVPWFGSDLEVDIADSLAIRQFAINRRPRVILNAAAYTAVDDAETDEPKAKRVNGDGPEALAELAREIGALIVHVSTDYVFDGALPQGQAYAEDAATGPMSVYGHTKLLGEQGVARAWRSSVACDDGGWLILRTSWLFGAGRSSFVDTMLRLLLEKEELRVVSDQVGRPTYVEDLADVMLVASGLTGRARLSSGIWHFANYGAVSWHGYATAIRDEMLLLGVPVKSKQIHPVSTDEFPRPARRPNNSVLDTTHIERDGGMSVRPWQSALHEYLQERFRESSKSFNSIEVIRARS